MARKFKKQKLNFIKIIEFCGKPIFFLFTLIVISLLSLLSLINKFIQRFHHLKFPQFHLPSISIPRFRLHFPRIRWVIAASCLIIFFLFLTSFGYYWYVLKNLPSPDLLRDEQPSLSTKIFDRNGQLLYQIYRDQNRTLIHLSDLPQHLIQATIASEDKNFYNHRGIDLSGIIRAAYANLQNCKLSSEFKLINCSMQGGSTLTQQLVKNALLTPEKSLARKINEAYLAILVERKYTKAEILEMYFNYVPYGGTAYGIEEAAHQYLGKSARDLTLPEAALLAGLPVAPTTLSPFGTRPYLAKNRQMQVLSSMVEMGYIKDDEALAAKEARITLRPQNITIRAPHFVMYVKDLLVQSFGEDIVSRGGLEVTTTLDSAKQQILEKEISKELLKLQKLKVGNAAGMITSPPTGEILAMAGSHDFFDSGSDGQVNVVLQPRQPGSSIKPITYTLAFMNGLSPTSRIDDTPICFVIPGQPNYCPHNYDSRFHGNVSLTTALASSYNIPAIKLLNSLGISRMVDLAKEMGITTWNDPSRFGLSLTLGGGEVTMYDMAQVYSVFANRGTKIPLKAILSVKDSAGNLVKYPQTNIILGTDPLSAQAEEDSDQPKQIIPETVAFQISNILSDPLARAPAFGTRSVLNIPGYQVAVKTGTTNSLRDNWTIGYTPELLVATWVGNNDNTPMSSVASGITGASPIWSNTMKQLLAGSNPITFQPPAKMLRIAVCPSTGAAYCPGLCTDKPLTQYFVPGTEPKKDCSANGSIISGTSI